MKSGAPCSTRTSTHTPDSTLLLTRDYQRGLGELPDLQREITTAITASINANLQGAERRRLGARREVDHRAYDAYLRGRFHMERGELEQGRTLFEQAGRYAPDWAPPNVGLANYTSLPFFTDTPPIDVLPKARAALVRALELDETLAEAHAANAYIRASYEWDWRAAEQEFRRALELQPNYADAARRLREILKTDSTDVTAKWGLGLVAEQQGNPDESIAILEPISANSLNRKASLGHAYAVAGQTGRGRSVLGALRSAAAQSYVPSYYFAVVHAGLGQRDEALRYLERAYEERSTVLAYLRIDPRLAPLRNEPRFIALARRLGQE